MNNFKFYQSVFSWRYGTDEMRHIFCEENKYKIWRNIWVALAKAQNKSGLVTDEELSDLENNKENIDIEKILEFEKETKHDVVAAIREYASIAKIGGKKIHYGATSMDIVDNTDALRIKNALMIIEQKILTTLNLLSKKIEQYKDLPCMGYTHLQPAEPTTLGYRLSIYAQDLITDFEFLQFIKKTIKGKGIKGAVGTQAGYEAILSGTKTSSFDLEKEIMEMLDLEPALISTQVYPRKYDYLVLTLINSIASSIAKFASDLRLLQAPAIGEWSEPFAKSQVGSSAMPFKRNPINSEKICSLARYITGLPNIALENATHSYLERTLDDSANKRIIIPEAFLALDEILVTANKIIEGLVINTKKIEYNLLQYGVFSSTEAVLIEAVKSGADRQQMHETLREISLVAWQAIQESRPNPMQELLQKNKSINQFIKPARLNELLDIKKHVGTAPDRCRMIVEKIKKITDEK